MTASKNKSEVCSALESRQPARSFRDCTQSIGEDAALSALDEYLGDYPDGQKIRKTALALDLPENELRVMAESSDNIKRRISRLLLLEITTGITEDSLLQKGLTDKSAKIRCDAARFTGTGADRTRLYNQLIRLIREDPDARVRKSAGKRLAESFADLYSIDFDGLPALSRMLILDALEGHSRIDEERAEAMLDDKSRETAFRAARNLQRWGTLGRLVKDGSKSAIEILKKAAALGVAEYLEKADTNNVNHDEIVELAGRAGRDDLVRRLSKNKNSPGSAGITVPPALREMEKTIIRLTNLPSDDRKKLIDELPIEDPGFRKAVENAYPPPERDISSEVLFELARYGQWVEWSDRLSAALSSEESSIRRSAITALSEIAPGEAVKKIPSFLLDSSEIVRESAAAALASIPSGKGCPLLAQYLKDEPEPENRNSVITGIRSAGAAALARCILDNWELLGAAAAGEMLMEGIDEVGVELLADGFTDETDITDLLKHSGFKGGLSLLRAWNAVDVNARKRLLSCLMASGWAEGIPGQLEREQRLKTQNLSETLKILNRDELTQLLEPVAKKADGRNRRLIRSIMKG
jgi:hypothetical protein